MDGQKIERRRPGLSEAQEHALVRLEHVVSVDPLSENASYEVELLNQMSTDKWGNQCFRTEKTQRTIDPLALERLRNKTIFSLLGEVKDSPEAFEIASGMLAEKDSAPQS